MNTKLLRNLLLGSIGISIIILATRTHSALALGNKYFGGMKDFEFSCDCTGNTLLYIKDYKTNSTLALLYQPGSSKVLSNYNIYGQYLLGSYSTSGGECQYYVGEDCVEMSTDGTLNSNPGTGTST